MQLGFAVNSSAPAGAIYNSAAYSPSLALWCAVGASLDPIASTGAGTGYVMTSPDAVTWTSRTPASNAPWQGVCWAESLGLFVAVGGYRNPAGGDVQAGVIMTSPDGVNWTSRTSPSVNIWSAVAFDGTNLVAVSNDSVGIGATPHSMTSTNGTAWTSHTLPSHNYTDVVWNGDLGKFYAIGDSKGMFSTSGAVWTASASVPAHAWTRLCWSTTLALFVTVGKSGFIATSPDGDTYTNRVSGFVSSSDLFGCAWSSADSLFYCTVYRDSTDPAFGTSPDGITWTANTRTDLANNYRCIATSTIGLIMAGDTDDKALVGFGCDAGPDQHHSADLPNTATMAGQTAIPSPDSTTWTLQSSPMGGAVTIVDPSSLTTDVHFTAVVSGQYVLRLTVVKGPITVYDEMTVFAWTNDLSPVVTAGADQTAASPIPSTVTLTGTIDDPTLLDHYTWTQVSGPSSPAISSPATLATNIVFSSYVPGTYVFRLTATLTTATDVAAEVTVTVPAAVAPVVDTSTTTTSSGSATLSPTVTDDGWNGAPTYVWTQVAGPGVATILAPTAVSTGVTLPTPGSYQFQLVVTNSGFSGNGIARAVYLPVGGIATPDADLTQVDIFINGSLTPIGGLANTSVIAEVITSGSPNTFRFGIHTAAVSAGNKVLVKQGSRVLFAGVILNVTETFPERLANKIYTAVANDYWWQLTRRRITHTYTASSASAILADIITNVPGITGTNIAAGLPTVDSLILDHAKASDAINELAKKLNATAKIDYSGDLHFAILDPSVTDPAPLTTDTKSAFNELSVNGDISQLVNRVFVKRTVTSSSDPEATAPTPGKYTPSVVGVNSGLFIDYQDAPTETGEVPPSGIAGYGITFVTGSGETNLVSTESHGATQSTLGAMRVRIGHPGFSSNDVTFRRITRINVYREDNNIARYGLVQSVLPTGGEFTDKLASAALGDAPPSVNTADDIIAETNATTGQPTTSTSTVYDQVDDTASQTALAALLGGGDDGVIEDVIDAGEMTQAEAIALGRAYLDAHKDVETTLKWLTRDYNTHPGTTITSSIPEASGDFKIQTVDISGFMRKVSPVYRASASRKRISLEELLSRSISGTTTITGVNGSGGSGGSGGGGGGGGTGDVSQLGSVTAGHTAVWVSTGVIEDGGAAITPSATAAALDGTTAAGTSADYSRGDHKHADANRPTTGQKDALAGTSGTPSSSNKYVTDSDSRNTNSRAPSGSAGGDLTGTYPNPTVGASTITNAKLANMAAHTFKARKTNSTGAPEDATATEATALLDAVVGDSGSGGTKGLVPAPASGDAAAGKFLKADGTFAVPSGSSGISAGTVAAMIAFGVFR